jgi:hypothetical protein
MEGKVLQYEVFYCKVTNYVLLHVSLLKTTLGWQWQWHSSA